jgi:hypothetical protein
MKNEYLIPVNIIDLVDKFNKASGNEKQHIMQRVQAIKDYCEISLKNYNDKLNIEENYRTRKPKK